MSENKNNAQHLGGVARAQQLSKAELQRIASEGGEARAEQLPTSKRSSIAQQGGYAKAKNQRG